MGKLESLIIGIVFSIFYTGVLYLFGSFVFVDFNLTHWSNTGRTIVGALWLIVLPLTGLLVWAAAKEDIESLEQEIRGVHNRLDKLEDNKGDQQ
jgi:hypothetical protein